MTTRPGLVEVRPSRKVPVKHTVLVPEKSNSRTRCRLKMKAPRFILATAIFAAASSAFATNTDGTWKLASGAGNWSDGTKWNSSTVADGSGFTADFSTINITGDVTVHLDTPRTIGNLKFGDTTTSSAANWIIDNNSSASNLLTLAGATSTITVNTLGTGKTATISAGLAGTAPLVKLGVGTIVLSGTNTAYTGSISINAGTLGLTNPGGNTSTDQAGVGGSITLGDTTGAETATLQMNSANMNVTNPLTVVAGSSGVKTLTTGTATAPSFNGSITMQDNLTVAVATNNAASITFSLGGTGNLDLTSKTLTLYVAPNNTGNNGAITIDKPIIGTGNISITAAGGSTGTRTVTLTNLNNSYSGQTSVTGGTLLVNGSISGSTTTVAGSGTGTLAAVLGGNGTLGDVTIGDIGLNGVISGGTVGTIGTLRTGALSLLSTATYKLDLNSTTNTADFLNASGALSLDGTLAISDLNQGTPTSNLVIAQGTRLTGTFSGLAQGAFVDNGLYTIDYGVVTSNAVTLVAVVPEPSAVVSLIGGMGMLTALCRRRSNS
jgi:autotransporter-associated beta strand protein